MGGHFTPGTPTVQAKRAQRNLGSTNTGPGYEVWDSGGTADASFRHVGIPKEDGDTSASPVNISRKHL